MTPTARALAKFHSVEEIETMQGQVLAARYNRAAVNLHIAGTQNPDGNQAQLIALATIQQQDDFLADCEEAIAWKSKQETSVTSTVDFSRRYTRV